MINSFKTLLLALCAVSLAPHAPADTLYLTTGAGLYRVDNYETPGSPSVLVGNSPAFGDIAIDAATGRAWGVGYSFQLNGNELFSLNLTTGTAISLGAVGPAGSPGWNSLTYANGVLYAGFDNVYSLDLVTLQTTLLFTAAVGSGHMSGDIAYNPLDGNLYSANSNPLTSTHFLQRYDLSLGTQTTVGNFSGSSQVGFFAGGLLFGLDFDSAGNLFGATSGGNLFEINPADASVSLVSSYGISPGGMASVTAEPTPEPSTPLLTVVGALIIFVRWCLAHRRLPFAAGRRLG